MNRKIIYVIVALIVVMSGLVVFVKMNSKPMEVKASVTVHKTATCGCCGNYVGYLRTNGYDVKVVDHPSDESLRVEKRQIGIPESLDSCHTTVFNDEDYFVEGHIPLEAFDKLLAEKPPIKGIGMPGMPSASPGMPGRKTAPFSISKVALDGVVSDYVTL